MKNYAGIISRLHNTPLLMNVDKLRVITEAVTIPLILGNAASIERVESGTNATAREFGAEFSANGRNVFIISVFDSLVSKQVSAGSGMTSYQSINAEIDRAIAAGATDIGFFVDTPGGEPSVFGLSEKIRSLPSRGINTFSFCDMACSAGYAIVAATQKIYATQVAQVGSIAAIAVHMEISKQAKKEGKTYTVMRSKGQKALGDPYTALGETEVKYFTSLLETLDTEFNNDVVKSRSSLTLEKIKELDGKDVIGHEAVKAGLVDAVVPNLENALSLFLKETKTLKQTPARVTMEKPELETQLAAANAKVVELTAQVASLEEASVTKVTTELERVDTILSTAQTLKLDLATAQKYTDPKYSADIATEILTDLAASRDANTGLDANVGASATAGKDTPTDSGLRASYKAATNI